MDIPDIVWISSFFIVINKLNTAHSVQLRGAGASFPAEVYKSWTSSYIATRRIYIDLAMSYDSVGSGGGKSRIQKPLDQLEIEYAGSDSLLKESEYTTYPSLRMFPSMAGAVVIGYNLPGITKLVLSRDHIVGIYNGTYNRWNDSSIQQLNPTITLPGEEINVYVRKDKSGTTEIFTKALSSFSPEWAAQYGYFSKSLDSNDMPINWNSSVVKLYGPTNRGLSGLILTFKYSVAYLSVADASEANIPYASILNKYGKEVLPNTENIQAAMNAKASAFTSRFTVDLVDADDISAYPISAYTYMVLRMDSFINCDQTVALYRYIEWFSTSNEASQLCAGLEMVPLSSAVAKKIQENILNMMNCNGKLVSTLVEKQKHEEYLDGQTWRTPVYAITPIVATLIILMIIFLVWQQVRMNRAIWNKEYLIPAAKVKLLSVFGRSRDISKSALFSNSMASLNSRKSVVSGSKSIASSDRNSESTWANSMMQVALYDDKEVCLRKLGIKHPDDLKTETKRNLLHFRDKIHHLNVLAFYGLTQVDDQCYLVSSACNKGILRDVLQSEKFNLDINFKYSISLDIAAGMEYLHSLDYIHTHLTSAVCYIDLRWTVKIADWEYLQILSSQKEKHMTLEHLTCRERAFDDDENVKARRLFWKDPDLLLYPNSKPLKSADVYSFAIILIEIFTREDPYDELSCELEPKEIIQKIMEEELRPEIPKELSQRLQLLISTCWMVPAASRPTFTKVVKILNQNKPSKKSVLDCMMEVVESYAVDLEQKVHERTHELNIAMKKTEDLLHQMLPPSIATKLAQGEAITPESVESVTIFFSDIVGFTSLSSLSSPLQIVKLLNDLYTTFDCVIDKHQVYKVETIGDAYMVISGLPQKCDKHASNIADMAIDFAIASCQFKVHHMPKERLNLRAGIHTGPVAAGVVGLKMPRYCLFGDTVNTASRMESTSIANKIQCSSHTAKHLTQANNYILHHRGEITVKGKGSMMTYWLHGKTKSNIVMPPEFTRTDLTSIVT